VDVVLTGVQPDEIALNPAEAGAAGDSRIAASVEALFREHYGRIAGMLTRLTGDRAHSEEIASDVFHKLSQRPALLESREDLTAWIYRVATNAGFDALRTNRPYRDAWPLQQTLTYIQERAGMEFDQSIVTAFMAMIDKWESQVSPIPADPSSSLAQAS